MILVTARSGRTSLDPFRKPLPERIVGDVPQLRVVTLKGVHAVLIELEGLELCEDGLRIALLVPVEKPAPKPGLRKARTIETTGETLAEVVPLRAAGERR